MSDPDGPVVSRLLSVPNMDPCRIVTFTCVCCGKRLEHPRIEYREEIQTFLCLSEECRAWLRDLLADEVEITGVEAR